MRFQSQPVQPVAPFREVVDTETQETTTEWGDPRFQGHMDDDDLIAPDHVTNTHRTRHIRARSDALDPSWRDIPTKVAGSTFAKVGQQALQLMQELGEPAFTGPNPRYVLALVGEWTNAVDNDAILLYVTEPSTGKRVKLGYLPNKARICRGCGTEREPTTRAGDQPTRCPNCSGELVRNGVASKVSRRARELGGLPEQFFEAHIAWEAGGVTGGGTMSYGLNIRISSRLRTTPITDTPVS